MDGITEKGSLPNVDVPERIWFEMHDEGDTCDVIVKMEDGTLYTALFVTLPYLERQMDLCYAVTQQIPGSPAVRYAALDTPHILVENLQRETIEDTIDNLIILDVFESVFIRVTETDDDGRDEVTRTNNDGRRATQEVAAVVLSDVLVVND